MTSTDIRTITQGDRKPDLQIVLSDVANDANFSALDTSAYEIIIEQGDDIVVAQPPTSVDPSDDGKSVNLVYEWGELDTANVGRMYVRVWVEWPDGLRQTFPADKPLYLDVRPAPAA